MKKLICPECGEKYDEEDRVKNGMKCGRCAYNEQEADKNEELNPYTE